MRVLIDVSNGRISEELLATRARAGHSVERGAAHVWAQRFDGRIRGYGANTAIQPPSDVGPVN